MASRRLSHDDRAVLREEGYSIEAIASRVKCSHSAVSKTLKRLKESGSVDDRPRSGRHDFLRPEMIENWWELASGTTDLQAHS